MLLLLHSCEISQFLMKTKLFIDTRTKIFLIYLSACMKYIFNSGWVYKIKTKLLGATVREGSWPAVPWYLLCLQWNPCCHDHMPWPSGLLDVRPQCLVPKRTLYLGPTQGMKGWVNLALLWLELKTCGWDVRVSEKPGLNPGINLVFGEGNFESFQNIEFWKFLKHRNFESF